MSNKKNKRPDKIAIFGKTVSIVEKENFTNFGESNLDDLVITIRKGLDDKNFETTLLHEVIHVMLHISGWNELLEDNNTLYGQCTVSGWFQVISSLIVLLCYSAYQ